MAGFDWKGVLGSVAPGLATVLGGPFAGMAVAAIGKALGIDAPTQQKIQDALTTGQLNGDQLLALKKAELELQQHLKDNEITLDQLVVNDRDSARKREEVVKDWTPRVLAFLVVLLTILGEGFIMLRGMPPGVDPVVVGRVLGTLDSALMLVLSYYFGSSVDSFRKTELLAKSPASGA